MVGCMGARGRVIAEPRQVSGRRCCRSPPVGRWFGRRLTAAGWPCPPVLVQRGHGSLAGRAVACIACGRGATSAGGFGALVGAGGTGELAVAMARGRQGRGEWAAARAVERGTCGPGRTGSGGRRGLPAAV